MNGWGVIAANDESTNSFYIVCFTSVPYTLPKYVGLDGNQLAYGDLVFNAIYTYPGRHKSLFYVEPYKNQKSVTVSMNTVSI